MPFKSEAQRRHLEKNHPEIAKAWAADTPADAKLPERVESRAPTKPAESRIQQIAKGLVNRPPGA